MNTSIGHQNDKEDRRNAVGLLVTLSSQVMAATLALIAIEGAFATFVLDKRQPPFWFYLLITLTFLSFIFSILNGGAGINKMTTQGSEGNWKLESGRPYFQRQTVVCLFGVLLFFASLFFSGPTKEDQQSEDLKKLQQQLAIQQTKLDSAYLDLQKLRNELLSSTTDVGNLKNEVERLRAQKEQ